MARLCEDRYFKSEEAARAYAADFLAQYSGAWNPYEGSATVCPPNAERSDWLVIASRNSSAD